LISLNFLEGKIDNNLAVAMAIVLILVMSLLEKKFIWKMFLHTKFTVHAKSGPFWKSFHSILLLLLKSLYVLLLLAVRMAFDSGLSVGSISAALSSPVFVPPLRGDECGLIFPNSGW